MYRSPDVESLPVRVASLFRLPFELGTCLGAGLIAKFSLAVDPAVDPLAPPKFPGCSTLKSLDPHVALGLTLRSSFPAFRRSLCEDVRSGSDARWDIYESQAKAATEFILSTNWSEATKISMQWLRRQWQLATKARIKRSLTSLADQIWRLCVLPLCRRCRIFLGKPNREDKLAAALARLNRDCEVAKVSFRDGNLDSALSCYSACLQAVEFNGIISSVSSEPTNTCAPNCEERLLSEVRAGYVRVVVNMALCYKKLGRFGEAVESSTVALQVDPSNTKALFIRGSASIAIGNAEGAICDLALLVARDPANATAKEELRRARAMVDTSGTRKAQAVNSDAMKGQNSLDVCELEDGCNNLSRASLLALLVDVGRAQGIVQHEVTNLVRRLVDEAEERPKLSFVEAHRLILELGLPEDPLQKYGFSERDLHQLLLEKYSDDEEVTLCAEKAMHAQATGDRDRAEGITLDKIVQVHKCMVQELRKVLDELEMLSSNEKTAFTRKSCEAAAELLVTSAVEHAAAIRCEDVELAVAMNEDRLLESQEFAECTQQLSEMMMRLWVLVS